MQSVRTLLQHTPIKYVEVNGVDWTYIAAGEGEPLVFLNGGLRYPETAFHYIKLFSPHYRVIVPGYPPINSMYEMVGGVLGVMTAEGVVSANVLGQSYGGMVGQAFARIAPHRINKLILSHSRAGDTSVIGMALVKTNMQLLPMISEKLLLSRVKAQMKSLLSFSHEAAYEVWSAYLDELFEEQMTKADIESHFSTVIDAIEHILPQPSRVPMNRTLLLFGDRDPAVKAAQRAHFIQQYQGAQVHVFQNTGHTSAMERPDDYFDVVHAFLQQPME